MEVIQREFLGVSNEAMEFSEETLAKLLLEIADDTKSAASRMVLLGLARVLSDEDEVWRLSLRKKQGSKVDNGANEAAKHERYCKIAQDLWQLQKEGWPREAAVEHVVKTHGVSRATVFKAKKHVAECDRAGFISYPSGACLPFESSAVESE